MNMNVLSNQLEEIEGLYPEYPYVLHRVNCAGIKVPWHWHEEVEFDYILEGEIEVVTTNKTYVYKKNEAFFINTNMMCMMKAKKNETERIRMDSSLFHPIFLGGHFKSIFETKYIDPVLKDKKIEIVEIRGINSRQKQMLAKLKVVSLLQEKPDKEFQTRNLFSEIWLLLLEEIKESKKEQIPLNLVNQERIQTMMSYIHQNYHEKISLDHIAASAAVSKRECIRCFHNCIGRTPFEYLLDYRIQSAERLLRNTEDSIAGIAQQSGFSNGAYFGKLFKEINGMTPGAYRSMQKG